MSIARTCAIIDIAERIADSAEPPEEIAADLLDLAGYAVCPWCDADLLPLRERAFRRSDMSMTSDGHGDRILVCQACAKAAAADIADDGEGAA